MLKGIGMVKTIATLGELMMRLKPPGKLRLRQAHQFEICHGGAEANVASALAQFGMNARLISALPNTEIGTRAVMELRSSGVDTRFVSRIYGRMGLYFMEEGADYRSGCVVYDRADTAFSRLSPNSIDWDAAFGDVDWFHISGITPAISASTRSIAEAAVSEAAKRGVHISIDLNYRERLWDYGVDPIDVLPGLVAQCHTLIAGRGDCPNCLGVDGDGENGSEEWAVSLAGKITDRFPNLHHFALTIRSSSAAEQHDWKGYIQGREAHAFSRSYSMKNVIDRVGTGDAFCAGLIHELVRGASLEQAVNFGAGATCLKHSIAGDFNAVTADEVQTLIETTSFGRLRR